MIKFECWNDCAQNDCNTHHFYLGTRKSKIAHDEISIIITASKRYDAIFYLLHQNTETGTATGHFSQQQYHHRHQRDAIMPDRYSSSAVGTYQLRIPRHQLCCDISGQTGDTQSPRQNFWAVVTGRGHRGEVRVTVMADQQSARTKPPALPFAPATLHPKRLKLPTPLTHSINSAQIILLARKFAKFPSLKYHSTNKIGLQYYAK